MSAIRSRQTVAVIYAIVIAWAILALFISANQTREIRNNEQVIREAQQTIIAGQSQSESRLSTALAAAATYVARGTPTPDGN